MECKFTKDILDKLENINITTTDQQSDNMNTIIEKINNQNDAVEYLANELQKIYKYLKTEQDKKIKISSSYSLKVLPD